MVVTHVHVSGWAHQDIRPDHVLVQAHGAVSLIDFGQARPLTAAGVRHNLQALGAIVMWLAASPILARDPAVLVPGARNNDRLLGLLTADPQGAAAFGRDPLIAVATRCRAGELDAAGLEQAIADIELPTSDLGRWLSTILDALPETVS